MLSNFSGELGSRWFPKCGSGFTSLKHQIQIVNLPAVTDLHLGVDNHPDNAAVLLDLIQVLRTFRNFNNFN